jgi:hypothetical protein
MFQTNDLLQEFQDFFPCSRKSRCIRALIYRIQNDVPHRRVGQDEDFLQTFSECFVVRLLRSGMVLRIQVRKNMVTGIGFGTELGKKGSEDASDALLRDVFEIKVIVTHQGQSLIAFRLDFVNNARASVQYEYAEKM